MICGIVGDLTRSRHLLRLSRMGMRNLFGSPRGAAGSDLMLEIGVVSGRGAIHE
jgi:hypothetical protein